MASFDGLERMEALLAELGNPEKDFKVIHIAGTNGKGSTAVMIASILEEAGYSVGLYTSPHLETECERVQLWDGTHHMIEQDEFDALMDRVRAAGAELGDKEVPGKGTKYGKLTVFEVYTAAAYLWFAEKAPDYVVLETGLGGRLDSTNTIEKPLVSVITQVGLDHTAQLGNTVPRIAREKAGIIKSGVPVVSQTQDPMVKRALARAAVDKGAEFIDVSGSVPPYPVTMHGLHQIKNAAAAVEAVKASGAEVPDEAIMAGLEKAILPGRFEIMEPVTENGPAWVIDGAHNPDAIDTLAKTYTIFARANKIKRTLVIFGCMKDKNSARMVQLLTGGLKGCFYTATAVDYERAEDPGHIAGLIRECGRKCQVFRTSREAYEYARGSGFECVLVCGSIYLAGEMRRLILS